MSEHADQLDELLAGEQQAWDRFWENHYETIIRRIQTRSLGEDADSLLNSVGVSLAILVNDPNRSVPVESVPNLVSYMVRIGWNKAKERLRKRSAKKRGKPGALPDGDAVIDRRASDPADAVRIPEIIPNEDEFENEVLDDEIVAWLEHRLGELNEKERKYLSLHLDGFTDAEIGMQMNRISAASAARYRSRIKARWAL